MQGRNWFIWLSLALLAAATAWAVNFNRLPPADFTFCNGTEIKSVDPAIVTGAPEGRIITAIFEGLTNWHPKTLEPQPGVAERWDISDDRLVYTFHLRDDARWSDGTPVTADDFYYSFRRFLDPRTAAEYSYQLWYVKNAERYTVASSLAAGDPVEVELANPPGTREEVRGPQLHGMLIERIDLPDSDDDLFVVEIDGRQRRFHVDAASGAEPMRRVLFDFREVGIEVVDAHTLRITLSSPTPFFLRLTGFYPLFPVNRKCVETHGYPLWTKPENIVSNGAFRLQYRRIRDRIRLVRSDTYWNRHNVALETVDALAVQSEATMLNLYLTGQADWITTVPNTIIPQLAAQRPKEFAPQPYLGIYYYRVNVDREGLSDSRVRRALALAIDRQEIVDTATRAGEQPASSFVPPGLTGYTSPSFGQFDPEQARRLLAEAGYPGARGLPTIDILYNSSEAHKDIAELIQDQWKRHLGLNARLRAEEWNSYLSSQRQQNYWVSRAAWIGDYPDPNTFLDMFVTGGANNQTGWSNARYDELIEAAALEVDTEARLALMREAEEILLRELPVIPIYYYVSKDMVRPYVQGFHENVQDVHPLHAIRIDREQKQRVLEAEGIR